MAYFNMLLELDSATESARISPEVRFWWSLWLIYYRQISIAESLAQWYIIKGTADGRQVPENKQKFMEIQDMNAKQNNDISNLSFEQAIKQLSAIVEGIEQGRTPLEDSLSQYEKGMALIKQCRAILQKAEKRIEKLSDQKTDT